jgi:hypothetical protein
MDLDALKRFVAQPGAFHMQSGRVRRAGLDATFVALRVLPGGVDNRQIAPRRNTIGSCADGGAGRRSAVPNLDRRTWTPTAETKSWIRSAKRPGAAKAP